MGLNRLAQLHFSPAMHELYLEDFPRFWQDPELKKRIVVIGANDYIHKWNGDEFINFSDTPISSLLDWTDDRIQKGALYNGSITGLPLSGGNHQLLFYDKKQVARAPSSFKELVCDARRLKADCGAIYPFVLPTNACYFILPLLYGFGSPLWCQENNPALGITRESLKKTLILLKDLMYDNHLIPIKWEQYHSLGEFLSRKAAYCIGGDWDITACLEVLGYDLGIAKIGPLEQECLSTAGGSYLFISKYLDNSLYQTVKDVAEIILSNKVQEGIVNELNRFPARKDFTFDYQAKGQFFQDNHSVFKDSIFLPPLPNISHTYHVLAELLEPGILVRYPIDDLTDWAIKTINDENSGPIISGSLPKMIENKS